MARKSVPRIINDLSFCGKICLHHSRRARDCNLLEKQALSLRLDNSISEDENKYTGFLQLS